MKRKTGSFAAPAFALSVALTQLFASTCLCNAFRTVVASSGGDGAPFWVVLGRMVTMTTFRLPRPFTYSMRPWWTIGLLSPLAAWFRAKRPGKGGFTIVLELLVRRLRFRCVGWLVFLWLHTLLPSSSTISSWNCTFSCSLLSMYANTKKHSLTHRSSNFSLRECLASWTMCKMLSFGTFTETAKSTRSHRAYCGEYPRDMLLQKGV